MITCCRISHIALEYTVKTIESSKYDIGEEFIEKTNCKHCNCLLIRYIKFDKAGNLQNVEVLRGKKAKHFLDKTKIISQRYKDKLVDYRWWLPYTDNNKVKKCYSNLSGLKIGLIDQDPYRS